MWVSPASSTSKLPSRRAGRARRSAVIRRAWARIESGSPSWWAWQGARGLVPPGASRRSARSRGRGRLSAQGRGVRAPSRPRWLARSGGPRGPAGDGGGRRSEEDPVPRPDRGRPCRAGTGAAPAEDGCARGWRRRPSGRPRERRRGWKRPSRARRHPPGLGHGAGNVGAAEGGAQEFEGIGRVEAGRGGCIRPSGRSGGRS